MQCSSCGASYSDTDCCTKCGAAVQSSTQQNAVPLESETLASSTKRSLPDMPRKSTLLEFPGVVRSTVPDWRRELSERVREVQERRAREAAREAAEAEHARLARAVNTPAPQLELLPQAAVPTINPLVAAALRRIERANQQYSTTATSHARSAAAVAYVTEEELDSSPDEQAPNLAVAFDLENLEPAPTSPQPEKIHNLVVVPTPVSPPTVKPQTRTVAKRLISDNDPVLDYLETVPTSLNPQEINNHRAGILRRVCGALLDLSVSLLLFSPFAAAVELTNGDWHRARTLVFAGVSLTIVSFLYMTTAMAFTGRTLGMRTFSLRAVDRRTGLIPTGGQSAGRAAIYLASVFALGVPALYVFVNREGYAAHDRMTQTVVVLS